MNIAITGASGLIGRRVVDIALRRGHEVTAFSRHPERAIPGCTMRLFSLEQPLDLEGCDAVLHLAGESVLGLWTPAKKRRIVQSRVEGTRHLVAAINRAKQAPEVFVCGSAIGYYGNGGESELTETSPQGVGFLPETTARWEAEALKATGCRTVLLRTALVLGNGGGALKLMEPLFRFGLGGEVGNGQQWMSWIHLEDQAQLALFAIENMDLAGPLNAAAPWPVRNAEFTRTLARRLHRPAVLRVPKLALWPLGDFRHELLDSKRVLPAVASAHGFGFKFAELEPALKDLLG